ncbi:hypothetical protein XA68_16945 [Ophiocordyceps unilateralis]|uniref:Amine oxidase domain-containing protein n=1 Tax=Ophiocordyceps unilateralis TaxID=268505 RepID=A0A2A9PJC7_OPHUN|nr:hypothetical protein XA68_16945 [Ophiocordyceps unilateralis]
MPPNDDQHRYRVTLFDKADSLSLDSASVTVRHGETGVDERVDLPMRACAGGYYDSLLRMCRHLGIPLHPVRFLFVFAAMLPTNPSWRCEAPRSDDVGSVPGSYFVYASNLHRVLPPRPAGCGVLLYWFEMLYLVICQAWFIAICFLVPPRTKPVAETLGEYVQRTRLPRRFVTHYLVPLMSSVSTCSHAEMLDFPASDVVDYKRLSHGQQHYAFCGGVRRVQSRLVEGVQDVRLGSRVTDIEVSRGRLLVHWHSTGDGPPSASDEFFDRVVLAVAPDVAASIFRPLASVLGKIPTKRVESSVLSRQPGAFSVADCQGLTARCSFRGGDAQPAQVVTLQTRFAGSASTTQAIHAMPSDLLVLTCPFEPATESEMVLHEASFTRTLRTPESRAIVRSIMGTGGPGEAPGCGWMNGEDNVWLAGSWCWDGMVLLEGCVVSAMRVAHGFGVRISWAEKPGRLNVDPKGIRLVVLPGAFREAPSATTTRRSSHVRNYLGSNTSRQPYRTSADTTFAVDLPHQPLAVQYQTRNLSASAMVWVLAAPDFVLGIVVGIVASVLLAAAIAATALRASAAYSLGHWKLNLKTPSVSLWMNLGYWRDEGGKPVGRFDEACLGLLVEMLKTAKLVGRGSEAGTVAVLDLGFGCGDQTLALARLLRPKSNHHFRYVGLTLDRSQLRAAERRLQRELASPEDASLVLSRECFQLFCADAAKPASWTPAIRDAVLGVGDADFADRWLLALDCLYHFSPSRRPVFGFAAQTLDANVVAFDLILNEKASRRDTLLVCMVGLLMSCPLRTFLTEDRYKADMVECGYDPESIVIRDISDDVFAGVADYLGRQEDALSRYGISIGGFKLAGRLFGWRNRPAADALDVGSLGVCHAVGINSIAADGDGLAHGRLRLEWSTYLVHDIHSAVAHADKVAGYPRSMNKEEAIPSNGGRRLCIVRAQRRLGLFNSQWAKGLAGRDVAPCGWYVFDYHWVSSSRVSNTTVSDLVDFGRSAAKIGKTVSMLISSDVS